MTAKYHISAAVFAAFFFVAGCSETAQNQAAETAPVEAEFTALKRPNIFLITLEDLSSKFGAFGDPVAHTPNIDALAARGIKFTNVFTTAGVCAPSRSSLITGVHQQTLGTMHMRTTMFGRDMPYGASYFAVPPANVKAFPELLRAQGYYAINKSKTDYQFGTPFTVWDESSGVANWKNAPANKPLFAMINFNQTHESFGFPTDIDLEANRNAKGFVPRNIKFNKTKTHFTDPTDIVVPPYYPDAAEVRKSIALYYDNVARTDELIGKLIADIESSARGKNAVIILTTDHGDGLPRAKRTLYDSGLKVPTIIAYSDNRNAGTVREDLVSFVDMAPTILNFAGRDIPGFIQGHIFEGEGRAAPRKYIYAAADRLDEREQRFKAVRDDGFKYIRNYTPDKPRLPDIGYQNNNPIMKQMRSMLAKGTLAPAAAQFLETPGPKAELYQLSTDPYEVDNLAEKTAYNAKLASMSGAMDDWIARTGDLSAMSELDMVAQMWPNGTQPVTDAPAACVSKGKVQWRSATPGASIGIADRKNAKQWGLYTGPYDGSDEAYYYAKAVRYGYAESSVARVFATDLKACD